MVLFEKSFNNTPNNRDLGDVINEYDGYTYSNTGDVWANGYLYSVSWDDFSVLKRIRTRMHFGSASGTSIS